MDEMPGVDVLTPNSSVNDNASNNVKKNKDVPTWLSTRYCLVYLAFFGFFNVYALRVNLSVAIVSMVNASAYPHKNFSSECGRNTSKASTDGEFIWTATQSGLVLSAFFYGYIWSQVPGGYLSMRFGGKYLFGGGVLCTTVLTLLTAVAARANFALLIALRVVEGLGEGVTFPAMHAMFGVWAPPSERARLSSMAYAGAHLGTVVAQPVSGILCASTFLGGWPSVFYVFGSLGLLWCVLWFLLAYSKPSDHPRISIAELTYIQNSLPKDRGNTQKVPWKQIFTSMPVYAIMVSHFCNNWGFYTLLTCLPTYLKNVLGYDISEDGFIAALPYFVMWIMINLTGHFSDTLIAKNVMTVTRTRKVFNSVGLVGPGVFLIAAGFTGCNNTLAIAFICCATACASCCFSGYNINHVDLAPSYAGILMGITNTVATIPGIASPAIVSLITTAHPGRLGWRYVFFIAAGIYFFGTIFYNLFATAERQSWNEPEKEDKGERRGLLDDDSHED